MKSNPFATRFVRPGQLPWIEQPGQSLPSLVDRFRFKLHSRATIVGPHGTGKSTLLEHLVPLLGQVGWRQSHTGPTAHNSEPSAGCPVVWISLRRDDRPRSRILASRPHWSAGGLLVLDGLEQLSPWEIVVVSIATRISGMGLLATCHRASWLFPTLVNTQFQLQTVQRLVVELLHERTDLPESIVGQLSDRQMLHALLLEEQGNVREVFMRLYDDFEQLAASSNSLQFSQLAVQPA